MIVAVIAPGAMGAAVGKRLTDHGVEVRTLLEGRGAASVARAAAAGMRAADPGHIAEADFVLSIVPPGEAPALAERLAPAFRAGKKADTIYADCNAVSPQTARRVGETISATGVRFVDAGIVGGPPKPGDKGPTFYASGPWARDFAALGAFGLAVKPLDGDIGAASGLKMSYAGITKGMTALAAAMILAAARFGAGEHLAAELAAELADSQPALLARFAKSVPDMRPKAYRWVAEMEEIAAFAGEDAAARDIYLAIARLYDRIARDHAGEQAETAALDAFFERARQP